MSAVDPRRLASARQAAGLRPVDVARQLGVDRQRVWQWENGLASPGRRHLLAMAAALGVPVDQLLARRHSPLQILRLQAGLTLDQVAARAGVALTTYAGWERGGRKRGLPDEKLRALATALGVDTETVRRALIPQDR